MAVVLHMMPKGAFSPFNSFARPWQVASHGHIKLASFSSPLQHVAASGRQAYGLARHSSLVARVGSHDMASNENDFDLSKYRLAEIVSVRQESSALFGPPQWVILLKIQDTNNAMAVFVGDFEGTALNQGHPMYHQTPAPRPMTHDMMKNSLLALGARVSKICITALVENTYHACVYFLKDGSSQEITIDARPSDALNLARRFNAPIYINRVVADRMSHPLPAFERKAEAAEVPAEIQRSCKEALKRYHDPTVVHKINMQIAIQENRFEDAAKIRNEIERLLSRDRTLSLVVAMESALEDKRWEEAAYLRNELTRLIDQVPEGRLQET